MIKLLLVEDDPDMLDLTAYVLRRERFVVAEASDGAQALRRWRADRPDLVILDLGLPALDGFEVLRNIRGDSETPVLVLTGRRDAQDILRAFNLGTDDFMPKPFEFRELVARVRAVLRRSKLPVDEPGEPRLQLDGLSLDPQTYEVGWRGARGRLHLPALRADVTAGGTESQCPALTFFGPTADAFADGGSRRIRLAPGEGRGPRRRFGRRVSCGLAVARTRDLSDVNAAL